MTTRTSLHIALAAGLCLTASSLSAQLSGVYTIDPAGSGSRNYKTFAAASFDLFMKGISAPVVFDVAAGNYTEHWILYATTGSSSTNTVTFRSPTRGAATFTHTNSAGIGIYSAGTAPEWVVLDGFTFRVANNNIIRAVDITGNNHVVRHCTFTSTGAWFNGDANEIHHCRFTGNRAPFGFAGRGGSFHHNEVRLTNGRTMFGTFSSPRGTVRKRVYNNLFSGDLFESNSQAMTIAGPTDFVHNTVVQFASSRTALYPTIEVLTSFGMVPRVSQNIIVNMNTGRVLNIIGRVSPFYVDVRNNLYFAPNSSALWSFSNGTFSSLSTWQTATGQDAGSIHADPQFVNATSSPTGLRLKAGSPAVGKAIGTLAYVTDDFGGQKRVSPATIGAYEGFPQSTFTPFGKGCPGASNFVPVIGYSGTLQMGSTNFAVTLAKARGGGPVQAWFAVGATKVTIPFGGVCNLLVSPDFLIVTGVSGSAPGNGIARIPFNLPSDPKLRGASAHLQWGVVDSAATGGVAFSNAATLTL